MDWEYISGTVWFVLQNSFIPCIVILISWTYYKYKSWSKLYVIDQRNLRAPHIFGTEAAFGNIVVSTWQNEAANHCLPQRCWKIAYQECPKCRLNNCCSRFLLSGKFFGLKNVHIKWCTFWGNGIWNHLCVGVISRCFTRYCSFFYRGIQRMLSFV